MSSALKPVITPGGPQAAPVPAQLNKPMHTQNASAYGQTSTHLPQNLVSLPHNAQSTTHIQPNHTSSNAHPTNHYSINVPNAPQHFSSGNQPTFSIPASHPLPSVTQSLPATTFSNATKTPTLPPQSYQPNLGQPPNVPVTQTLLPTQASLPIEQEKPQSNGTPEPSTTANEVQQNHASSPKEKTTLQPSSNIEKNKPEVSEKSPPTTPIQAATSDQNHAETKAEPLAVPSASESPPSENKSQQAVPATADSSTENVKKQNESEKEEKMEVDNSEAIATTTTLSFSTPTKKEQNIAATPKSSMKTTSRVPRKTKPSKSEETYKKSDNKVINQKSPSSAGKSKRNRTRTQPYQCPLPEIEIIRKISTSSRRNRNNDDKLIIFYKNEFLAVRNLEGSFYVCQAMQNIYKSSPRIKIRWLSQDNDKSANIYTPDFYDQTDFDCILTNLELERIDKGRFKLPASEQERTDSILKRALAVEKGDATPTSLTEEHPDGLDLSLYKEESQLKKSKGQKRKSSSSLKRSRKANNTKKSPEYSKVRKLANRSASKTIDKPIATTSKKAPDPKKSSTASGRSERAKRRSDNSSTKSSPVVDHKKAKVLAKIGRKTAVIASKLQSNKTSVKAAPKPIPTTSKQQKVVASTSQAGTRKTKRTRK